MTVVDQTGGKIPEAKVNVSRSDGARRLEASQGPGAFLFTLAPGAYSVSVEAEGFAPGSASVAVGEKGLTEVKIALHLAIKEVVTVQGLRLENMRGRILTAEDLKSLPSNESAMRYMLLELAGSRGRPGDVSFYVDGFSDFHRLPPKGAIELVRINAEPYSAEFSEPGTRRIEIITKPGAEGAFGEMKLDFNDETLNATEAFANGKPELQRRSFSGYYAAPIVRDKWGFYAYAGRWEQDENAVINATVLDLSPAPVAFSTTLPAPFRENNVTLNSGYALGSQRRMMVEYSRNTTAAQNQGLRTGGFRLPEQAYEIHNRSHTGRLSLLSVYGLSTLHELRIRVTGDHNLTRAISQDQAVTVLDSFTSGGNQDFRLIDESNRSLQLDTKITRSFGRLALNAGMQLDGKRRDVVNAADFGGTYVFGAGVRRDAFGVPIGDGEATITPIENYLDTLLGSPGARPTLFTISRGDPRATLSQWEFAAFAQGDWQASDTLTLSYGLRYEHQTNLNDRFDLAPRFGLTWNLGGAGLIRAGSGVFFDRVDLNLSLDLLRRDPARLQRFVVPGPEFYFTGAPDDLGPAEDRSLLRRNPDMRSPREILSNVSYEREIPWSPFKSSLFGAVGYTHGRASRVTRLLDDNAPMSPELSRPNADAGQILRYDSLGRSSRQELQLSVRASLNADSRIFVNYALASTRSDADSAQELPANSYDLAAEYGAAQTDERHRLFVSGNVALPRFWMIVPSVTASSGRPFNIVTGLDNNGDAHLTDRPAFANAAADPDAIQTPWGLLDPSPEPGDVIIPRNYGRGTAQYRVDLMIMKIFAFPKARLKTMSMSLNLENVFNNVNRRDFNGVLVSPVFGHANTAQPARRASLGFVVNF